jgi:transformation/transcription domain-associated protein
VQRLQLATEIRDNIEIVHTAEYRNFLQFLFPVFYNILRQGTAQFIDGSEQKLRNIILEILNRLPNNELLRPYVQNLLKLCMYLLEVENEENAIICLRIIIDLHKNYRPSLEGEVQPFLDIVQKIYSELPKTVQITFKGRPSLTSFKVISTLESNSASSKMGSMVAPPVCLVCMSISSFYRFLCHKVHHRPSNKSHHPLP